MAPGGDEKQPEKSVTDGDMSDSIATLSSQDPSSGTVQVATGRGFNAFAWTVPWRGRTVPVLGSDPAFPSASARPSGSGIPILFPFAGRIRQARFSWEGQTYQLEAGDGQGNAIHGWVLDRPWKVTARADDRVAAEIVCDAEACRSVWPAPFELRADYRLDGPRLQMAFSVTNRSASDELPCGLGLHPYFAVPRNAAPVRLEVPARRHWILEDLIPTGRSEAWSPSPEGVAARAGELDDVISDWETDGDGVVTARVVRQPTWPDVRLRFRAADFPFGVLYAPPHGASVCIEPYSMLPNAIELDGVCPTGLWRLAPGETKHVALAIEVEVAAATG